MKIKSLLIGSAAVVAAASGARAADAVVMAPAPEPMEYVRVCDVYGAGFFYIPGTETCLKIGGFVWYQIGAGGPDVGDTRNQVGGASGGDEYSKYIRTRVYFDARSETEWGTLRGYIQMQSDYTNGSPVESYGAPGNDPNLGLDEAWLSIGGLRMGYAPSAFTYTVNGGPSGYGTHSWSGLYYGYSERQFIQYNFTGSNGLFATISLENDPTHGAPGADANYIPDVVGKIGLTQGWGTVWGTVGVDEDASDTGDAFSSVGSNGYDGYATGDTEWAASAGIFLNIPGMTGDSFKVVGYYASDPNAYWGYGDWSVLASYYHQFTPTFGASVGGQYISNTNFDVDGDPNLWAAELNLIWTPVKNFEIRSELQYAKETDLDGSFGGYLRFTRYFGG